MAEKPKVRRDDESHDPELDVNISFRWAGKLTKRTWAMICGAIATVVAAIVSTVKLLGMIK